MVAVATHLTRGDGAQVIGDGIQLEGLVDAPAPRVGITIGGLDTTTTSVVNVWRTADGERTAVKGGRRREVAAADYIIDWEVPLNRDVWYELELVDGVLAPLVTEAGIRLDSDRGYIADPAVPTTTVEVFTQGLPGGAASLADGALRTVTYGSDATAINIMDSARPVVLTSGRRAATDVELSILVEDPTQTQLVRQLFRQSVIILVRGLPEWSDDLPGTCYLMVPKATPTMLNRHRGGTLELWEGAGQIVAAPAMDVIVPPVSYGDVEQAWLSYQQIQDAFTGRTYLDAQKDPFNSGMESFNA